MGNIIGAGLLLFLTACAVSYFVFRPFIAHLQKKETAARLLLPLQAHTLLGVLFMTGAFFLGRWLGGSMLPLIATALGWTLPAIILSIQASRHMRAAKEKNKEV